LTLEAEPAENLDVREVDLVQRMRSELADDTTPTNEWFIASLSGRRDDLSQWRAYRGGEGGYTLDKLRLRRIQMLAHFGPMAVVFAVLGFSTAPAVAIDGEVLITQSKALQGGVTPGDDLGFPITISRPGVYKLAGHIQPTADQDGILVTSKFVTIDLAGFSLLGGSLALSGIRSSLDHLTIRNGTIGHFKRDGITDAGGSAPTNWWVIEGVTIFANGRFGVHTRGVFAYLRGDVITNNGSGGIEVGFNCHIESNIVAVNGNTCISIESGTVLANTISTNGIGILNSSINDNSADVAFGNNLLYNNEFQTSNAVIPLEPNACNPACP
jgi:hypothetical protein